MSGAVDRRSTNSGDLATTLEVSQQSVSRWEAGTHKPRRDQIDALAAAIRLSAGDLRRMAGYDAPMGAGVVRNLPLDALGSEAFEQFTALLLDRSLGGGWAVHRLGKTGHDQAGGDIVATERETSRRIGVQCKRIAQFGPRLVESAIKAFPEPMEQKVLALSRVASPQAREVLKDHPGWEIWDQDDLSRRFRTLPDHVQDQIVETYFPGQSLDLLGRTRVGPWQDLETFFRPFSQPGALFTHEWELSGRDPDLDRLMTAVSDTVNRLTVLSAPGGMGKSRLLLEAMRRWRETDPVTGLWFLSTLSDLERGDLMDQLYRLFDQNISPTTVAEDTARELRGLCGGVDPPPGGSLTIFTRKLPLGLGFPEVPSTHLFTYPDAGLAVVNGFAAARVGKTDDVAVLIDPQTTEAPEIEAAAKTLSERGLFVRRYSGKSANVRDVSDAVDHFPYDIAIFATHCGDSDGLRWTYEFPDAEGRARRLTVDVAVSLSRPDPDGRMQVMEFMRFHELDGVDWTDEAAKEALPVGSAISTFMDLRRATPAIQPIERSEIGRVLGSAAMKMHDHNWLPLSQMLADRQTPVILNNACVSWHELGGRFLYGGARAYIGTLWEVTNAEASAVVTRFLGKHFGKALPHALWCAQNDIYGDGSRRPYVMTGVYTQSVRPGRGDTPRQIIAKLASAKRTWDRRLGAERSKPTPEDLDGLTAIAGYYEAELAAMTRRWG